MFFLWRLSAVFFFLCVVGVVFADVYSVSDDFALAETGSDPWVSFSCNGCSVSRDEPYAMYSGSVSAFVEVDAAGTSRVNAPPEYSFISESREFTPGPKWTTKWLTGTQVQNYNPAVSDVTVYNYVGQRTLYDAGSGFQNAFAVALSLGKENFWETGSVACEPLGGHRVAGDRIYAQGKAAVVGSDIEFPSNREYAFVSNGGKFRETSEGTGPPLAYRSGFFWGPVVSFGSVQTGPKPPLFEFVGNSDFLTVAKSTQPGIGADNTKQVPLYPVALLYCDDRFVRQVAPASGSIAFYKTVKQSRYSNSPDFVPVFSKTDEVVRSVDFTKGWPSFVCSLERKDYSYALQMQENDSPVISSREKVCNPAYYPSDLKALVDDGSLSVDSKGCVPEIVPTASSIAERNQVIADYLVNWGYSNCVVKTFSVAEAAPDNFEWYFGADFGNQFEDLAIWASKVYMKYGGPSTDNANGFYCELLPNPVLTTVNSPVVWTVKMYDIDEFGRPTEVFWPRTVQWSGSDGVSAANTGLVLSHSYSTAQNHYLSAKIDATNAGKNYSAVCSNTVDVGKELAVSCFALPQTQTMNGPSVGSSQVSFTAYASGGSGSYSYVWSFDPEPNSFSNPQVGSEFDYSGVVASYDSSGVKVADVVVTDSSGATASATCNGIIEPFEVSCTWETESGSKVAYVGENVKWKALMIGSTGNANIQWSGSDSLASDGTIESSDPNVGNWRYAQTTKAYSAPGTKTALITVSRGGVVKTAQCGQVEVVSEPSGPACIAKTVPSSVDVGKSVSVSVTAFKFASPVTSASATCGDSAAALGIEACNGIGDRQECMFSCNGYVSGGTASVTFSNDSGQSATCAVPVTIGAIPSCSLSANPVTLANGQSSVVTVSYANFSSGVSSVVVDCGQNATNPVSAPTCTGTSGTCSFTCSNYAGNSNATATLNGIACTPVIVESEAKPKCQLLPVIAEIVNGESVVFTVTYSGFTKETDDTGKIKENAVKVSYDKTMGEVSADVTCYPGQCTITCGPYMQTAKSYTSTLVTVTLNDAVPVSCGQSKIFIATGKKDLCQINGGECLTQGTACGGLENTSFECPPGQFCCLLDSPVVRSLTDDIAVDLYERKSRTEFVLESAQARASASASVSSSAGPAVGRLELSAKITLPANSVATSATLVVFKARAGEQGTEYYTKTVYFPKGQSVVYVTIPSEEIVESNFARGVYIYEAKLVNMKAGLSDFVDAVQRNNVDSFNVLIRSKKLTAAPEIDFLFVLVIAFAIVFIGSFKGK